MNISTMKNFPSCRELFELFQKDYHNILPDVDKYREYFAYSDDIDHLIQTMTAIQAE